MRIQCLPAFKKEFEKLRDVKAYRGLESDVIDYFFNKPAERLMSGTRLNQSNDVPYIKKRISGSGGYRAYFLLLIKDDRLILMFVHPKTGPYGASNIDDDYKAFLYKEVLNAIESNDLVDLEIDESGKHLVFKP